MLIRKRFKVCRHVTIVATKPSVFSGVPELAKKAETTEAVHLDGVAAAVILHQEVQDLLQSYSQVMDLVSHKFVSWDSMLSQWEQELASK